MQKALKKTSGSSSMLANPKVKGVPKSDSLKLMNLHALPRHGSKPGGTKLIQYLEVPAKRAENFLYFPWLKSCQDVIYLQEYNSYFLFNINKRRCHRCWRKKQLPHGFWEK